MAKRKTFFSLCLAVLLCFGFVLSVHASDESKTAYTNPVPFWVNVMDIDVSLSITNGNASMGGMVIGNSGTESISVNARLERANPNGTFTHIVTFSNLNVNGNIWAWQRNHMVARGHYYRLTLTATVVRNGVSEVVSLSNTARAN